MDQAFWGGDAAENAIYVNAFILYMTQLTGGA